MLNKSTMILAICLGMCAFATYHLWQTNAKLKHNMAEVAAQLRLQSSVNVASEQALKKQQETENEIRETRKERETQLNGAACLTGDAHIDYLLRLLDEDYEARCGKATGNAAGSVQPSGK